MLMAQGWIAVCGGTKWVGASMAAMLGLLGPLDASAQERPSPAPATAQLMSFDIPAQPLADALAVFGQQAGWQVSYTPDLMQGLRSTAVVGAHSPAAALGLL